jgi:glyoxylase-like metal-dependent hydrolase (beta-lactamase superfamily II)
MLVDGAWIPTFPNARYMFSKKDWDWLNGEPITFLGDYAGDSVRPVIEAGLADLYEPDHALTDEVSLVSTPGHSPGHISVSIKSRGESAIVTGDLIHHPCQMAQPRWASPFDFDQAQALETRLGFLEHHCDEDTLIIGTHFPTPTAGFIVRDGVVYRFKP